MIIVKDYAALKLIAPDIIVWLIYNIWKIPSSIHYIDCNELNHDEWERLVRKDIPLFEEKCSEYRGWAKFSGNDWMWLLREIPRFENYCTEYDGWGRMNKDEWRQLLNHHPQFKKYRK